MNLKKIIGDFFGFNSTIRLLEIQADDLFERQKYWRDKYEASNKSLEKLLRSIPKPIKPVDVPTANIVYRRPILVGKNKFELKSIDVRLFLAYDFLIEKNVSKLMYNGTQDLNLLIPKIYKLAKENYKYGSDDKYGFSEYWMFPFELRHVRSKSLAGDCDDYSNWIGAHFAAAKIPSSRWLVSCGTTRTGIGHATIYAKDNGGAWRHLNSTKPDYKHNDLSLFPRNKDPSDRIGIKENGFWFSYNNVFSIHSFDSEEAKESFEKEKLDIKIKEAKE